MAEEIPNQAPGVPIYDISTPKPTKGTISPDEVTEAVASGRFSLPKGTAIPVVAPDGTFGTLDPKEAPEAFKNGYRYQTAEDQLQQKYGSTGQQLITGAEGAANAASFGLSTGIEKALGVPEEDIRGRRAANPWSHGLGQAAGLVGSALIPGLGEASLANEAAHGAEGALAAAKAINPLSASSVMAGIAEKAAQKLGMKGAEGIGSQIAESAVKGGIETAIFQGGDEISKMLSSDPNQSMGSAAADIGLAGILGSGLSGGMGAVSPLWKASTESKLGQFISDFKGRIGEYISQGGLANGEIANAEQTGIGAGRGFGQKADAGALRADATPLKGLPENSPGPDAKIRQSSSEIIRGMGLAEIPQTEFVKADPDRGAMIANAYEQMAHAPNDPAVQKSYQALIDESLNQFRHLRDNLGIQVDVIEPGMKNPYPNGSSDMIKDVRNKHLWVFPTESGFGSGVTGEHPLLSPSGEFIGNRELLHNDIFRAVHDVFGHAKEGVGFGPHGEENAWQAHARMYSPDARAAMTSETRGQNSWVNFGPKGEMNLAKPGETVYAEQKAGLLPDWVMKEGFVGTPKAEPVASVNPSLTPGQKAADAFLKKGLSKTLSEALGTAAGSAIGGALGHSGWGALLGERTLAPFFDSILPGIIKPIMQNVPSPAALKSAVDYGMAVIKGNKLIEKAAKGVFDESEVLASHLVPGEKQRSLLSKFLEKARLSPESLMQVGGSLGNYLPEHAATMAKTAAIATQFLNSQMPHTAKASPLDSEPVLSDFQKGARDRLLDITEQPLLVMDRLKKGMLTPQDVTAVKTIYPGLYENLAQKVTDHMIKHTAQGGKIPYNVKLSLSLFLGQPLDSTMSPAAISSVQNQFANPAKAAEQSAPRPRHSTAVLSKTPKMYLTSAQAAQARNSEMD